MRYFLPQSKTTFFCFLLFSTKILRRDKKNFGSVGVWYKKRLVKRAGQSIWRNSTLREAYAPSEPFKTLSFSFFSFDNKILNETNLVALSYKNTELFNKPQIKFGNRQKIRKEILSWKKYTWSLLIWRVLMWEMRFQP